MVEKVAVLAPFHMSQLDGNITLGAAVLTTGVWGDIWRYQVPQGTGIVLQAGDTFSLRIDDDAIGTEVGTTDCYVKIEVRDPGQNDNILIWGPNLYLKCREFEDRNKIARLQLAKPVKVYPRQWIAIAAKDVGTVDTSECYFDLLTSKVAVPL